MSKKQQSKWCDWETKPMTWNTRSRWKQYGWRVIPRSPACATLYNAHGKNCPLFNKDQLEPIAGAKAAQRRAALAYSMARGQIRKLATDWFIEKPPANDDILQDDAIAASMGEFLDWWNQPIELNQSRRDMLRFEFEKEVCRLMGRDYADYAYCETF